VLARPRGNEASERVLERAGFTRSPAARASFSESKMIIESPFNPSPPVDHVR
jgi:RimJ/RimL family protein N-acetyltransferase